MTDITWVLVAHRAGARLFEHQKGKAGLVLKQEIPHDEGRLQKHDLISDRQGRADDTRGGGHHNYEPRVDAVEHVTQQFAKQLAGVLDQGRTHNQYSRLILVAEPHFLGHVRQVLSAPVMAKVTASVDKDLGQSNADEINRQISGVL